MFRTKRDDTLVATIERRHGIDVRARGDMTLGTRLGQPGLVLEGSVPATVSETAVGVKE